MPVTVESVIVISGLPDVEDAASVHEAFVVFCGVTVLREPAVITPEAAVITPIAAVPDPPTAPKAKCKPAFVSSHAQRERTIDGAGDG